MCRLSPEQIVTKRRCSELRHVLTHPVACRFIRLRARRLESTAPLPPWGRIHALQDLGLRVKTVSIVLIEDNRIVRDVISRLIEEHADFTVRALSANVDDTLRIINDAKPEIVLLDSGLRDHDSLRLTARIHKQTPSVRIVVMGLLPHDSDITAFVQAGARGFIMKQAPFDEFMATLRAVALGEDALPRKLTSTLFDEIVQHMLRKARLPDLRSFMMTRREREVVSLVCECLSNK